ANAVLMAEGWGRAAGRLGVATCTHGPGLSNTITALIEGVRNRTPLLLVTGDTPVADRDHLQNLDQHALVAPTGAGFEPIRSSDTIAANVATAIRRARVERRPIVLNVPMDIEWETDVVLVPLDPVQPVANAVEPDPAALDVAVGILASANRPIVLAGRGAVHAGARPALIALAEALGAPLATSLLGSGYFTGDPWNLGIYGTLSHPVAQEAIASADCVITFGASLNYFTTDQGMLLRGKRVIQCDLDPARIGSTVPIDAGVVGDATKVAETITAWLAEAGHTPSSFRSPALADQLAAFDASEVFDDRSTEGAIDPRTFTLRLDTILPEDRTLVVDAGRFMLNALTLSVPDPLSLITTHGFGAIGLGMSNAIGAGIARPNRPTVLAIGDGGFMMGGMGEFHTAVEHNVDLIVVLYNDGSYGAEHIQLYRKQMDTKASLHHWPDLPTVMTSLGAKSVVVEKESDLDAVADAVQNRRPGQPLFIEARLDPDMVSAITSH
ncbi:MAG: thiamine pyrophosphate-binding protein, partial [Acidimicrobiia bacterium]|nr:thiamine pyrophosphate-binding protein [Acidimicrobiia bacterium]